MSNDNQSNEAKLKARYQIISHTISPMNKMSTLYIRDSANDSEFKAPVRIIVGDDDFIAKLSAKDVRLATHIHEEDKQRLEKAQLRACQGEELHE